MVYPGYPGCPPLDLVKIEQTRGRHPAQKREEYNDSTGVEGDAVFYLYINQRTPRAGSGLPWSALVHLILRSPQGTSSDCFQLISYLPILSTRTLTIPQASHRKPPQLPYFVRDKESWYLSSLTSSMPPPLSV